VTTTCTYLIRFSCWRYLPILIATSRRDDCVHPGYARKMAAKLQAMGYEPYYYEPAAGGHGCGKDNKERAAFTALGYNVIVSFTRSCMTRFPGYWQSPY
jgi:prolyl oligopeptidase PreP (S9A serine peptidase family)